MTYPIDEKAISNQDPYIEAGQPGTEIEAGMVGARFWIRAGARIIDSAAYIIDALFFGAVAAVAMDGDPQAKRLGDRWGHTVVVKKFDSILK